MKGRRCEDGLELAVGENSSVRWRRHLALFGLCTRPSRALRSTRDQLRENVALRSNDNGLAVLAMMNCEDESCVIKLVPSVKLFLFRS